MGSICTNNFEKEEGTETAVDTYKNAVTLHVTLGSHCSIDLILGHYKQHRSQSLFAISELKNIQHCDPLRDYTNDADKTIQMITSLRKTFIKLPVNKFCLYKKLLLCVLPHYRTEDAEQYQQQFRNVMKEVAESTKQFTVQFVNTIEGIHTLPNQMLLAIMLKQLGQLTTPMKVNLITTEKKMMNLYKYELMKTQNCSIRYNTSD